MDRRTDIEVLPPFYVGQEVVAVAAAQGSSFKNGHDYVVSAVEYRLGNPDHPVGKRTKYWYVGIVGFSDVACFCPSIFAPKQEMFSVMTFSEIVKKEELEVLLNN